MTVNSESLCTSRCEPCEGGVPTIGGDALNDYLQAVPEWSLTDSGTSIERKFNTGNFRKAVGLVDQIAELAEAEQHHPDLHLTGYRHLRVELTTHAIGGLSPNDFILAAKIDRLAT